MKLKYYMRGLGIGILIATIVLSLGSKKEKLTDTEIMAKARELGMVMKDEDDDNKLEEVLEKSLEKETKSKDDDREAGKDTEPNTDADTEADTDVDTGVDMDIDTEAGTDVDTGVDLDVDTEADTDVDTGVDLDIDTEVDLDVDTDVAAGDDTDVGADVVDLSEEMDGSGNAQITFTVERGMSSRQVSELLAEKGLIDDAVDFDDYIKRQGKASVIRIGIYTLPKNANYQTILNTITR